MKISWGNLCYTFLRYQNLKNKYRKLLQIRPGSCHFLFDYNSPFKVSEKALVCSCTKWLILLTNKTKAIFLSLSWFNQVLSKWFKPVQLKMHPFYNFPTKFWHFLKKWWSKKEAWRRSRHLKKRNNRMKLKINWKKLSQEIEHKFFLGK